MQSALSVTVTFLTNMKVAAKHYLVIVMLLMVQQVGSEISFTAPCRLSTDLNEVIKPLWGQTADTQHLLSF